MGGGSVLAQTSVSPEVLGAAGDVATGTTINVSYTIGEPVVETATGTATILTQGFQQPDYTIVAVDDPGGSDVVATLFPNPTSANLYVRIEAPTEDIYQVELMDIQGQILVRESMEGQSFREELELGDLAAGTYFVRILSTTNSFHQTFRVTRTN